MKGRPTRPPFLYSNEGWTVPTPSVKSPYRGTGSTEDGGAAAMGTRASGTFCAVVLAIALGALASPAWAGNGNGNGNSNGNGNGKPDAVAASQSQPAASPGNSGNAPGQEKKNGRDAKPDHDNGGPAPATTQPSAGPTQGVKPSNSTAKNTNAPAGSNRTKRYG